jgi:hypothetical protein
MEGSFLYFPKKNFNFLESFQECVWNDGEHFQHLL